MKDEKTTTVFLRKCLYFPFEPMANILVNFPGKAFVVLIGLMKGERKQQRGR